MGSTVWVRVPKSFPRMLRKNCTEAHIILVKLHKCFCSVNSKQGLAQWLHVFINLLDNVKVSFRKLHHTMLSQHCMSTRFPIPHPQFGGNIWDLSTFSLNFGKLYGEKSYSIIVLACNSFMYI